MVHPVITVAPDLPIVDAMDLMRREKIRHAPVVKNGELVGIVAYEDLTHASPSQATTLSIWELNYLLSKITVGEVMTRNVLTVHDDTPIEEAARIMADNKIGGLPVLRNGHIVGIITETNLFRIFLEALGAREKGVRVTALLLQKAGRIRRLVAAIGEGGGHVISLVTFQGEDPTNMRITVKISDLGIDKVREIITPVVEKLEDIRVC
jgi:acetoin utilization protein AcuB